jgi:hypothetical protein
MPDGRRPEPGSWNRIHFVVDDIASEVQRLKGTDVNFRDETGARSGTRPLTSDEAEALALSCLRSGARPEHKRMRGGDETLASRGRRACRW